MYLIDVDKIQIGDIFLTRSDDRESQMIRKYSNSKYSHAILYVGFSSCIESDGLGVQSQNIQRLLFMKKDDFIVLRVKDEILKPLISKAIVFARQKVGTEYSTSEAKLAMLEQKIKAKETNKQFCTRFIAQAYKQANIRVVENADYCSPQNILESDILKVIENVYREASDREIDFAEKSINPLEKQIDIHNYIFESVRKISGQDIQTFEQLSKFVLENPKIDKSISEIVENSGYLEMWKMDIEANPWHYDYTKFVEYYKNPLQREEVGSFFSTTEKETRRRFIITLDTLEFGYSFYRQDFFKIQIKLYKKLIKLSKQREQVGIKALNG